MHTFWRWSSRAPSHRCRLIVAALALPLATGLVALSAAPAAQAAPAKTAAAAKAHARRPAAPSRIQASSAGTNIGNAGVLTSAAKGTGAIVSSSDDWWVIYPGTVGGTVAVKVADNAPTASGCAIYAYLEGSDGTDQRLQGAPVGAGSSVKLIGSASGSDRYFVEVTADSNCANSQPYALTLVSGGGGTPPDPAAGSAPAGTSIADAWPPLKGHTLYAGALGSPRTGDWYVLYKKPDTALATIRVVNTGPNCALSFTLLDTYGEDGVLQNVNVGGNAAATFTVAAQEPQDPHGRYFVTVTSDGCAAGGPYSIEPEPSTQWESPAKIPSGHVPAGASGQKAWPPLHGHVFYREALSSTGSPDWYIVYKKPDTALATIRFENYGVACALDFVLYGSTATGKVGTQLQSTLIDVNAAATATVAAKEPSDPLGRYFVAVSSDGCASAGEQYAVEPEPGTQWLAPALEVTTIRLPKGTAHKAYSAAIAVSRGNKPYTFTAKTALPPGLSLSKATGVVSGTPTTAGKYSIVITITDSTSPTRKSVTYSFAITIAS